MAIEVITSVGVEEDILAVELRFEFEYGDDALRSPGPSLGSVSRLLVGLERWVALLKPYPDMGRRDAGEPRVVSAADGTAIRYLHLGSPLEVLAYLPAAAAAVPSLAILVYAAKRAFALDIEFKTHRARKQIEYEQVQELARQAALGDFSGLPGRDARAVEKDVDALEAGTKGWRGQYGAFVDPDDSQMLP